MCDMDKMLVVASDYFSEEENTAVSVGTKHRHTTELTVLIAGRIEFNSYYHRRDAFDVMVKHDLYVKRLKDGRYESGLHDSNDNRSVVAHKPTNAITDMAYRLISESR